MATEVTLPELGESVTEGTVTRWLKNVGDTVAMDEPLLEVSTDKVDTEIPSPVAGTLLEIKVDQDETIPVGALLAVIGSESENGGGAHAGPPAPEQSAPAEPEPAAETPRDEPQAQPPAAFAPSSTVRTAGNFAEDAGTQQPSAPEPAAASSGSDGTPVTLPELGESVTEGTVTRWLKNVGDTVAMDEPLLEVSTDKVDTEIPSPVAGTLLEIKVDQDETIPVGTELAVIGSGAPAAAPAAPATPEPAPAAPAAPEPAPEAQATQDAPAASTPPPAAEPPAAQAAPAERPAPAPQGSSTGGSPITDGTYVTPLVRKLAAEHGVELSSISGTGVGGRIRKQDVLEAAAAMRKAESAAAPAAPQAPAAQAPAEPSPLRGRTEPLSRLRKVIATRMVESLQMSAQLTTVVEVDVTKIARLRDTVKSDFQAREGVKLSFMPFFAKAAIDALKTHPMLNAAIDMEKGEVTYFDHENLSVAVDTERGLLTPVIKDAGDLSIAGLAKKIADVAERTRTNKITPDELAGGTFTLTNTGSRGALFDTPIINQPQVAILGTGSVVKRPVVIDDPNLGETIAVRQMVYLALTYDHRLVDGADAARFLSDVKTRLESGVFEV